MGLGTDNIVHVRTDIATNQMDVGHLEEILKDFTAKKIPVATIPVMSILMRRDPVAMQPGGLRFWGVMSAAILVGAFTAYPVNIWLVANGLKHGMGSTALLGRGGEAVGRHTAPARTASRAEIVAVGFGSVVALVVGVTLAVRFGTLG